MRLHISPEMKKLVLQYAEEEGVTPQSAFNTIQKILLNTKPYEAKENNHEENQPR